MKPKNIIVRMPNWIGDLVMATPLLQDLKQAYPNASLTAMCRKPICQIIEKDPNIDELFCFAKHGKFIRRCEKRNLMAKMRKGKYDLGILLTNSFSSAWHFWQGGVKRRIGYADHFRSFLLTDALPFPEKRKEQHLVRTYKELLHPLGIPLSETPPKLYLDKKESAYAHEFLKKFGVTEGGRLIGINPGAAYGSAKCWPPERFREVTEKLLQIKGEFTILFFGDRGHEKLIKGICQGLPSNVVNLAGLTTLRELMALISLCTVFLTNDSGPMHIADALAIPLVALFGSTDEVVTGPYQGGRVIHKHVSCSPCFKRTCPIDFRCMKEIASDEVVREIMRLLGENS